VFDVSELKQHILYTQGRDKMIPTNYSIRILSAVLCAITVCADSSIGLAQQILDDGQITKSFTEPVERSIAASPEVGIIAESFVKEGDRVRVGDPLASINHDVLRASLDIAISRAESTSRIDAATSQMELIKSQLEAIQSLVKGGHTNKFEVEQKQAEYENAYAEYRAADDELKLAGLEVKRIQAQINDRIISSPIDGIVIELHKQLGENISNNEPQYATVVCVEELKARFYLSSKTLIETKVGDKVSVFIGHDRTAKPAVVTFVSPVIDPDSGLGRLDVRIQNEDLQVQSGIICFWDESASDANQALLEDENLDR
jgi:RND family efflux transporter MFP subunit